MDKKSFVLYTESYQQIKKLNNTQKAQLLDAVFIYAETGETLQFDDIVTEITFGFIRQQLARNEEKYQEKKARNAAYYQNKKNAEKNKTNSETENSENNYSENSDSDNDNVNENVNVSVNDSESVSVNVNDNDIKNIPSRTKKKTKKEYGKWKNVLLSDDEYIELTENHNVSSIEEYIERLDSYIETSGKKYKNHFAVIGKWLYEDSKKADCKPGESASAAASDKYKFLINNI